MALLFYSLKIRFLLKLSIVPRKKSQIKIHQDHLSFCLQALIGAGATSLRSSNWSFFVQISRNTDLLPKTMLDKMASSEDVLDCSNCNESDHSTEDCPKKLKCETCGKIGHLKKDCAPSNKPKLTRRQSSYKFICYTLSNLGKKLSKGNLLAK